MADPHVISALNSKYARLSGELRKLERQTDKLRKDIAHIEATIRLFRAEWHGSEITPVAPLKPSRWGGRGQGLRLALDVLRNADQPMTAREIATKALASPGIELPDSKTLSAVAGTITACLERRVGVGVTVIEGRPRRWQLTSRGRTEDWTEQWRNGSS